jgi:hypothetical protein
MKSQKIAICLAAFLSLAAAGRPAERLVDTTITDFSAKGDVKDLCMELVTAWHRATRSNVNIVLEFDRSYYVFERTSQHPGEHILEVKANPAFPEIAVATSEASANEIAAAIGRADGKFQCVPQAQENVIWLAQQSLLQDEEWPLNRKVPGIQLSAVDTIQILADAAESLGFSMLGPRRLAEKSQWQVPIGSVPDREFSSFRELVAWVLGRTHAGRTWLITPQPGTRESILERDEAVEGLKLTLLRSPGE